MKVVGFWLLTACVPVLVASSHGVSHMVHTTSSTVSNTSSSSSKASIISSNTSSIGSTPSAAAAQQLAARAAKAALPAKALEHRCGHAPVDSLSQSRPTHTTCGSICAYANYNVTMPINHSIRFARPLLVTIFRCSGRRGRLGGPRCGRSPRDMKPLCGVPPRRRRAAHTI